MRDHISALGARIAILMISLCGFELPVLAAPASSTPSCTWYSGLKDEESNIKWGNAFEYHFSKDGKKLAVHGQGSEYDYLLDRETGKEINLRGCASSAHPWGAPEFDSSSELFVCAHWDGDRITYFDPKKQVAYEHPLTSGYTRPWTLKLSRDKSMIAVAPLYAEKNGTLVVINTKTGKKSEFLPPSSKANVTLLHPEFSLNNKLVAYVIETYEEHYIGVRAADGSGKEIKFPISLQKNSTLHKNVFALKFSSDNKKLYASTDDSVIETYSLGDEKKIEEYSLKSAIAPNDFGHADSPYAFKFIAGAPIAIMARSNHIYAHNLETGKTYKAKTSECGTPNISYNRDDSQEGTQLFRNLSDAPWILTKMSSNGYGLYNPGTNECRHLQSPRDFEKGEKLLAVELSPDGNTAFVLTNYSRKKLIDLRTGSIKDVTPLVGESSYGVDFANHRLIGAPKGNSYLKDLKARLVSFPVCITNDLTYSHTGSNDIAACTIGSDHVGAKSDTAVYVNEALLRVACGGEFKEDLWRNLTPDLPHGSNLTEDDAERFLFRFQKPGGFDPSRHLRVLIALLDNGYIEKRPDLIAGVFQNILGAAPTLYAELIKNYPKLQQLNTSKVTTTIQCKTKKEQETIKALVFSALDNYETGVRWQTTEFWQPVSPMFSTFDQEKKDALIDLLAQKLADQAADDPRFRGIFLSKLFKFTEAFVKHKYFGEPLKNITDLTVIREADQLRPIILGLSPIDNEPGAVSHFGIYLKMLPEIPVSSVTNKKPNLNFSKKLKWKHQGHQYTAELNVKPKGGKKTLITTAKGPKYKELWADQILTGVVITGSNLGGEATLSLDEYLNYFKARKFEFDSSPKKETDLLNFLSKGIRSGTFDYMIKEAHSDGDEKNLFRMNTSGKILTGTKILDNGRKEVIHLIFPDEEAAPTTTLLQNAEFGNWIRIREEAGKGQFVYFNTSCWSKTKALYEIEAAGTETLLNIPSTTTVLTFRNEKKNAEYNLFTAFREGQDFAGMRTSLANNDAYVKKTDNVFIFPDQPEYDQFITNLIKVPLDIDLRIKDENGKPYVLGQ